MKISNQLTISLSRIYLAAISAGFLALFFLSAESIQYAYYSFSAGDAAYQFYDDFLVSVEKPIWLFKCIFIVFFLLIFQLRTNQQKNHWQWFVLAICTLLLCIHWSMAILSALLLACYLYPWASTQLTRKDLVCWALALFALALIFRMEKLPNVATQPLQPDAQTYMGFAKSLTWGYDSGHREPLWAWLVMILDWVKPLPDDLSESGYLPLRLLSVFFSCTAALIIYLFGTRFFSHRIGFLAALLYAANKGMIYRSLQGLRLELFIILLLAAIGLAIWLTERKQFHWNQMILFGVVCGFLLLLRTSGLPLFVLLILWIWIHQRFSFRIPIIAAIIALGMAAPYYYYCWHTYGDPLYSANTHTNFYYQLMFPTEENEIESRSAVYMFFHVFPWYKSVFYTGIGTANTLFGSYALRLFYFPFSTLLIGSSLLGYILWLQRSKTILLLLCMLLLLGPMAFFVGALVYYNGVFDWRLISHLFPFMAFAAAEGLLFLLRQAGFVSKNDREFVDELPAQQHVAQCS